MTIDAWCTSASVHTTNVWWIWIVLNSRCIQLNRNLRFIHCLSVSIMNFISSSIYMAFSKPIIAFMPFKGSVNAISHMYGNRKNGSYPMINCRSKPRTDRLLSVQLHMFKQESPEKLYVAKNIAFKNQWFKTLVWNFLYAQCVLHGLTTILSFM